MKQLFYILAITLSIYGGENKAQGLLPSAHDAIVLNISDTVVDNTVIKRKAELFTMVYNMKLHFLSLTWSVKHYADSSGQYGEYLGGLVPDKTKETIADNTVFVNATNGDFVYPDSTGQFQTDIPIIGQYDFFNYAAGHIPIIVNDLIKQYGLKADWNYNLK